MNVLYDLSLLGFCGDDPTKITGMPRAIVETARRLRAAPDCRVTFCATDLPGRAYPFIRKHPVFHDAPLAPPSEEGLDPAAAGEAQVFHTTHSPVAHGVRRFPHLGVVQTVWDLIPFLLPEMFTENQLAYYGDVLGRLRPSDVVVTISESAKNDLCNHTGCDPARVHVTSLAADPEQFRPCLDQEACRHVRTKYGIPAEASYLLSLCTFEPRKNLRHVIRSFAALVAAQPDAGDLVLVLAGKTGWKFDAILEELAGVAHLRERIIVTGYVDDADLAPLYTGALAFLYLSVYEGFGLPPLEAMQCGTPAITANTSSLPEVLGDAGVLLPPDDQEALCQAMLDFHRRPEYRADLATRALERARLFSWERCARETLAAYRHAASGS